MSKLISKIISEWMSTLRYLWNPKRELIRWAEEQDDETVEEASPSIERACTEKAEQMKIFPLSLFGDRSAFGWRYPGERLAEKNE